MTRKKGMKWKMAKQNLLEKDEDEYSKVFSEVWRRMLRMLRRNKHTLVTLLSLLIRIMLILVLGLKVCLSFCYGQNAWAC